MTKNEKLLMSKGTCAHNTIDALCGQDGAVVLWPSFRRSLLLFEYCNNSYTLKELKYQTEHMPTFKLFCPYNTSSYQRSTPYLANKTFYLLNK